MSQEHGCKPDKPQRGVKLNLRITPAAGKPGDHRRQLEAAGLPAHLADAVERLREHEPAVMKWLAADDRRAAQFLLDPIGALAGSGIPFADGLLDGLRRAQAARGEGPAPPREAFAVRSMTVTAKPRAGP